MPGDLLFYSGIITKVKGMKSKLISVDNYHHIAQMKTTADFIAFLKAQPTYSEIYEDLNILALHRGQIERFLLNSLYLDYASVFRFASFNQRKALSIIFFRYEVNILKSCLQCVFNREDTYDLSLFLPFFNRHSDLKIEKLVASKTIEEFILNLKGTQYHPLFLRMYNNNHKTLYEYEIQLDVFYYKRTWKLINKFSSGKEQDFLRDILGSQIDLLNIMWIYRSKKHYNMDNIKTYAFIIPVYYKLSKAQLSKLVEAESIEAFASVVLTTYYKEFFKETKQTPIEMPYKKILNKVYSKNEKKYPASMAPIFSFLHDKELEIDRLTTALECIRYKLEPDEILNFVLKEV